MALGPGSIAFTGFNADTADSLAFVALEDLPAGTVIYFQDNEWNGSAFTTGEGVLTLTLTAAVTAGTIVRIESGNTTPTTTHGTIIRTGGFDLSGTAEAVYAFIGTDTTTPTAFLTALSSNGFENATTTGVLTGTGLTAGVDALNLGTVDPDADIGAYNGARTGQASFAAYRALLNDAANWITQDGSGGQDADGTAPDVPFSSVAFTAGGGGGGGQPTLSIADVSAVEGNAGTTNFTFTVTLSQAAAGDVTFNIATADGSATTAGGDFVAQSLTAQVIPAGSTQYSFTVAVTGDTAQEANEAFTVALSSIIGAAAGDTSATGTIINDDFPPAGQLTLISAIQGTSYYSPILAAEGLTAFNTASTQSVTVRAIVTTIDNVGPRQGFFLQEELSDSDGNRFTSEGIFVFTGATVSGVAVGDLVTLSAKVLEYQANNNLPVTTLVNPVGVAVTASNQALPVVLLDASHPIPNSILTAVTPNYTDSSDEAGDTFDATLYAMSYFETVEHMLVTVPDLVVADGFVSTSGGRPFFKAYSTVHADADQINSRGGYTIAGDPPLSPPDTPEDAEDNTIFGGRHLHDGDTNPDIIEIDFTGYAIAPPAGLQTGASMGDRLGDITGIIDFDFREVKLFVRGFEAGGFVDTQPVQETTMLDAGPRALTVASFNVENLDALDPQSRFDGIANAIATKLKLPDILTLEEIQDNNGAAQGGVTEGGITYSAADATLTFTKLINALNTAAAQAGSNAVYQWVDELPAVNAEGGEPGGNIRVGFLYNTTRVQLGDLPANATIEQRRQWTDRIGDNVRAAGDLIAYDDVGLVNPADWSGTRKSLLGEFTFNGNKVFVAGSHWPSKGGSGDFWQSNQNLEAGQPANADWAQRSAIGEDFYSVMNRIQTGAPTAGIVAGGDYNDFYFYRPLETATGYVFANGTARDDGLKLDNLVLTLPEAERYTFDFDGRSQAIDHILANKVLSGIASFDIVHLNTGFNSQAGGFNPALSDHEPLIAKFDYSSLAEELNGTAASETIEGFGGSDLLNGGGGADTLIGGTGNDTYIVDSSNDVVVELAGEGTDDTVKSLTNSFQIAPNVEQLLFIGTGPATLAGNTGNNQVTGGAGDDLLLLQQGGSDIANGDAGNDGFFFGDAYEATDVVNGGAGTGDQLGLQGNYAALTLGAISGVEAIVILSGSDTRFGAPGNQSFDYAITSIDGNVAAGQVLIVNANTLLTGEDLVFNGAAETDGVFQFFAGLGNTKVTGGAGSDGFFFGEAAGGVARLTADDRVDGGSAAPGGFDDDQLGLRGDYNIVLGEQTITGIETIVLLSSNDVRFGAPSAEFDYTIRTANGTVTAGRTLVVNGVGLEADETLMFNGAEELDGTFSLRGGAADDVLIGGQGNDVLFGGLGADFLEGFIGNDTYFYLSAAESNGPSTDTVAYNNGDRFDLRAIDAIAGGGDDAFTFIGLNTAFTAAGQLREVNDASGRRIEGDLDGNGSADFVVTLIGDPQAPITQESFFL